MIGNEAIKRMKEMLQRNTGGVSPLDSRILSELQLAQQRLERMPILPLFLMTERSYYQLDMGESRVHLPEFFLRENPQGDMELQNTSDNSWSELTKSGTENINDFWREGQDPPGRPKMYDYDGRYFRVAPAPDSSSYRLWMTYYRRGGNVTAEASTLWLTYAPDLVIAEAGLVLASELNNQVALGLFSNMLTKEMTAVTTEIIAAEQENSSPNQED